MVGFRTPYWTRSVQTAHITWFGLQGDTYIQSCDIYVQSQDITGQILLMCELIVLRRKKKGYFEWGRWGGVKAWTEPEGDCCTERHGFGLNKYTDLPQQDTLLFLLCLLLSCDAFLPLTLLYSFYRE